MGNYRKLYPGRYISAEDLGGEVVPVTIATITLEEMPNSDGEQKPVLYFEGRQKGMVLNKTNARRIAGKYGEDTDGWLGKSILIYPSETDLRGESVQCIRVKQDVAGTPEATPEATPEPVAELQTAGPKF